MRSWVQEWVGVINLVLQVLLLCFLAYMLTEIRSIQVNNMLQDVDIQSVREALAREGIPVEN